MTRYKIEFVATCPSNWDVQATWEWVRRLLSAPEEIETLRVRPLVADEDEETTP